VSVYKDLIAGKPDSSVHSGRRNQIYSLVDGIQFRGLVNMGEIALSTLQVLQLNTHPTQKAAIIGD
jgi:hypothetical protein